MYIGYVYWCGGHGRYCFGGGQTPRSTEARRLADAGELHAAVLLDGVILDAVEERQDELPRAPARHARHRLVARLRGAAAAAGEWDGLEEEEHAQATEAGGDWCLAAV